ncbi:MAG: LTA synthase family protein [Oscillospiraceae bacterium]|nr:LTA synthase family protein [Oscillospiraceae bacterium]
MASKPRRFFDFWLFQESARKLSGGKAALFRFWNWLLPLLASLGVGVLSLLLAFGRYEWMVFFSYFQHPLILLLNLLPPVLLSLLLYCAIGRRWIAHLITSLLLLALSAADYFMLLFRDDTLLFTDIVDAGTAMGVVGKYNLALDDRLLACLLYVTATTVFLALFVRGRATPSRRLFLGIILLLGCAFPLRKVYMDETVYEKKTQNFGHLNRWSATQAYVSRGFLFPFLHSVKSAFPTPPARYSPERAKELLAPYRDADIPEEKKVNVVTLMLESFCDMSCWDIPGLSPEVYASYHALEAESLRGTLADNIFAGGTVDTERCFLTGSGIVDNYRKNVNSYVWYFRSQGYRTGGSHPCYEWFYNRRNINRYLGFEDYYFVENHYDAVSGGGIAYDNTFFPELTRLCLEDFKNGPSFTYNLTYQGHGPYNTDVLWFGEWVDRLDYSQDSWMIMNNYFGSVKDTADRLSEMVDAFRDLEEPVVLVVFGDHKPWFGDANSVYTELGINLDPGTEEGFYNYYTTRWLIWANDRAKEVLGNDFVGEGPTLSPSFLMNYLFRECGWTGSAWMQYTDTVMEALPVLTSNGFYVTRLGTFTTYPSPADVRIAEDFRIADYWYKRNFLYEVSGGAGK